MVSSGTYSEDGRPSTCASASCETSPCGFCRLAPGPYRFGDPTDQRSRADGLGPRAEPFLGLQPGRAVGRERSRLARLVERHPDGPGVGRARGGREEHGPGGVRARRRRRHGVEHAVEQRGFGGEGVGTGRDDPRPGAPHQRPPSTVRTHRADGSDEVGCRVLGVRPPDVRDEDLGAGGRECPDDGTAEEAAAADDQRGGCRHAARTPACAAACSASRQSRIGGMPARTHPSCPSTL